MKILIALLSKSTTDTLIKEGASYLERLRPPFFASTLFINPKSDIDEAHKEKRMSEEGLLLLKKTEGYFRVALSEQGNQYSSQQFSKFLEKHAHHSPKIAFLIGGAFGLSPQVLEKSDAILSLSAFTMPHRMAFLVLTEQLYRAAEIKANSPYHK